MENTGTQHIVVAAMEKRKVEELSRDLLRDIWRDRDALAPECADDPFKLLDARIAATHLGYTYVEEERLQSFGRIDSRSDVAGLLDRQRRKVAISRRFPSLTQKFTGGHEIGHVVMHPDEVMHRDRPVGGLGVGPRSPVEREADHFSACFFVPGRLLEETFAARFGTTLLKLDEGSAFFLARSNASAILDGGLREFAFALASSFSYGGIRFEPLAAIFGVSIPTMAYRLEETGLITA